MNIAIPTDLEQFVQDAVSTGTYRDAAEVVGEGLRLLARREQFRRDADAGAEQLEQGLGIDGEKVFDRLQRRAEEIARGSREGT